MNRLSTFVLVVVIVTTTSLSTAVAAEKPWQAAATLRRTLNKVELYLLGGDIKDREEAIRLAAAARQQYDENLGASFRQDAPEVHRRIVAAFNTFVVKGLNITGLDGSILRNSVWTNLLHGGFLLTTHYLNQNRIHEAAAWISVREYSRNTMDTGASEAMDALMAGTITSKNARDIVAAELLHIYTGELRRALVRIQKTTQAGFNARTAGWIARAQGLYRIISPSITDKLGHETNKSVATLLIELQVKAGTQNYKETSAIARHLTNILREYSPTTLSTAEVEKRARLLKRFISLIYYDYKPAVRNGKIAVPLEYTEAVTFRDRSSMLLAELHPVLKRIAPKEAERLDEILAEMQKLISSKKGVKRIGELSEEGNTIISRVFAISDDQRGYMVAFQTLPDILEEMTRRVAAGDYSGAELKRLEAYSFYDPDIEQRLFPRSPSLSFSLESAFWQGSTQHPGLQKLIEQHTSPQELRDAVSSIKLSLHQAQAILEAKIGPASAFMQALAIMLREGMEAILVIAAMLGILTNMNLPGHGRWIWGGVIVGILASFATWLLAGWLIDISTINRELLEGITALLAAAVLIYVTHWIFHKTYVVDWVEFVRKQAASTAASGSLFAIGLVSFFVVYREGFETVLFYEALMIDAPSAWVLAGLVTGCLGIIVLSWLLIRMGKKLPIRTFFTITGSLLMIMAVIFTGFGIRGLQTAGLMAATPIAGFPESTFLQLYFGLFPIRETILAQGVVLLIFIGGLLYIRHTVKIRPAT